MTYGEFSDLLEVGSPLAVAAAAFFGLITSLGPCTFLRGATLFALVGDRPSRREGLLIAASFVGGLGVIYALLGLVTGLLSEFIPVSNIIYPVAGGLLVVLGVNSTGVIHFRLPRGPDRIYALRSRLAGQIGNAKSFVLGGTFGFMVCPCCLPALVLIFSFTFANGAYLPGLLLVAVFTFFHSIPLLLMGYFAHATQKFAAARRFEPYLNVVFSVLFLSTGIVLLWMA